MKLPVSAHRPEGIFLNTAPEHSAIYESGKMVYRSLSLSDRYQLDYLEIHQTSRCLPREYHFYVFNYHFLGMRWLDTKTVRDLPGLKMTLVLEMLPSDPFVMCSAADFDAYLVLDPTMNVADKRVYAFPRPLEIPDGVRQYQEAPVPVIASFGFATPGKGFELLVDAVNKEFEQAVVRINIPPMVKDNESFAWHYQKRQYGEYLRELCEKVAKPGVQVIVTDDYMPKEQLIDWCAENTLNCFLYNRYQAGLAATTDQAISSGRPLAVSSNETFRHIHRYLKPYPFRSLKESIASSQSDVLRMQRDWQPKNFALKFETVLEDLGVQSLYVSAQTSGDSETVSQSVALKVREDAIPKTSLAHKLNTSVNTIRGKLKLRTRLRKLLRLQSMRGVTTPLLQELVQIREQLWYVSGLEESDDLTKVISHASDRTVLIVSSSASESWIHQYGIDITQALRKSSRYGFVYRECSSETQLRDATREISSSAIIYNYDGNLRRWLTPEVTGKYHVPQLGIMHELTQDQADEATTELLDYYLCLDQTLVENNPYVLKTPRLIPPYLNYRFAPDIVTIGSLSVGPGDAGFERLIDAVQQEFDRARIILHIPFTTGGEREALATARRCRKAVTTKGIQLVINHQSLNKQQLLDFLAGNTVNAFFYDHLQNPAISNATDYALAVQKPLAITKSVLFRHLHAITPSICIEDSTLADIIKNDIAPLVPLFNEWSEARFVLSYERILDEVFSRMPALLRES